MTADRPPRAACLRGDLLVVDDRQDFLDSIQMVLEDLGHRVETVASGAEALRRVEAGRRYHLALCDLHMPGLSGWELAGRLKALAPATKVFLLTGSADLIDSHHPGLRAVDGVLLKTMDLADLERLLARELPQRVE